MWMLAGGQARVEMSTRGWGGGGAGGGSEWGWKETIWWLRGMERVRECGAGRLHNYEPE